MEPGVRGGCFKALGGKAVGTLVVDQLKVQRAVLWHAT